jgi:hypothetical protein
LTGNVIENFAPRVGIVRSRYLTAVAFDDGATDRKAHSQSFRLAGDEGIEDRLELSAAIPVPLS